MRFILLASLFIGLTAIGRASPIDTDIETVAPAVQTESLGDPGEIMARNSRNAIRIVVVGFVLSLFGSYMLTRATESHLKTHPSRLVRILVPAVILVVSFCACGFATVRIAASVPGVAFGR